MISAPAQNERAVTRIMARLIDADKRIAEIKKIYCEGCDNYGGAKCRACWVDDAMCLIDDATTVDAVPVVRCRDCKHRGTDYCIFHIKGEPADEELLRKLDNDFCSYGERKDGDGND